MLIPKVSHFQCTVAYKHPLFELRFLFLVPLFLFLKGWTCLHYAAAHANPMLVKVLLICGANTAAKSKLGRIPLEEANARRKNINAEILTTFKVTVLEHRRRMQFQSLMQHQYEVASGTFIDPDAAAAAEAALREKSKRIKSRKRK